MLMIYVYTKVHIRNVNHPLVITIRLKALKKKLPLPQL